MLKLYLLLPLVAALPTKPLLPELSISQWAEIQSGFVDRVHGLSDWSFSKAQEIVDEIVDKKHHHKEAAITDTPETEQTIWQQLKGDPHSFSRLTGVIEFVGGEPKKILDDPDLQITFFAPNNDALKPPEHHHHHHDHDHDLAELMSNPSLAHISSIISAQPSYLLDKDDGHKHHDHDGDDDDEKKKRRREMFKKIAAKVLAYHGLPKAYTASEIAQNSTLETGLKAEDGSYGGLHRRVRVEKTLIPPAVKLNFYARILVTDKKAKNGIFHTLNHPLLPPPSIFESLYLFPDFFSTLTSAVQGSHGRHYLDWGYDRENSKPGKPEFHGSPLATFFAPTNTAFHLLPPKLKFFLFSPFGERALTKVLAYHYVPHSLILSEFQYHEKHEKKSSFEAFSDAVEAAEGEFNIASDPSFHQELEVHTGVENATLKLVLDKSKLLPIEGAVKTTISVNGQQVETIDVPARNGAFHVINKLLVPPHHHHDHEGHDLAGGDDWSNWEQWLPAWAAQE